MTLAVDLILFGFLVKRAKAARNWSLPGAAMALLLLGPAGAQQFGEPASWLALSGSVLAESLFLAFSLLGLLALARWLDEPSGWSLGLAASAAAAATLTRFAAVSLIACAGITALEWGAANLGRRGRDAALLVGGGLLPSVGWAMFTSIQGGESSRAVVSHFPGRNLSQLLSTGSAWFFPSSIAATTRQVLFAMLLGVFVAMAIDLARLQVRDSGRSLRRVLGLFAVCYLATIEVTRFFLDNATPVDGRLLGPLQPVLYALMLGILAAWLRTRFGLSHSWVDLVAGVLVAAVALVVSPPRSLVRDGFVPPPNDAAAGRAIARLPADITLVTDNSSSLWNATGRGSLIQPSIINYTTGQFDSGYVKKLRDTLRFLRDRRGLYVRTTHGLFPSAGPSDFRADGTCLRRWRALPKGWSLWKTSPCESRVRASPG